MNGAKSCGYFIKHKGTDDDAAKNQKGILVETTFSLEGERSEQLKHKGGRKNPGEGLEDELP